MDPTSLRTASRRQKILLGTPLENHSVFGSVSGGPGAEWTGGGGGGGGESLGLGAPNPLDRRTV